MTSLILLFPLPFQIRFRLIRISADVIQQLIVRFLLNLLSLLFDVGKVCVRLLLEVCKLKRLSRVVSRYIVFVLSD